MIKVLIVEDDTAIRKSIKDELMLDGFSVDETSDGGQALARIIKTKPDMVILDLVLPTMNGLDILKKVRDDPTISNTKVMIFTNLEAENKMIADMIALKPCFYINKESMRLEELSEKIHSCVES